MLVYTLLNRLFILKHNQIAKTMPGFLVAMLIFLMMLTLLGQSASMMIFMLGLTQLLDAIIIKFTTPEFALLLLAIIHFGSQEI